MVGEILTAKSPPPCNTGGAGTELSLDFAALVAIACNFTLPPVRSVKNRKAPRGGFVRDQKRFFVIGFEGPASMPIRGVNSSVRSRRNTAPG